MGYFELKARKGLIKVQSVVEGGVLREVEISGDFFFYPEEAFWRFKEDLRGIRVDYEEILQRVSSILEREGIELVGCTAEDFAKAIYYSAVGGDEE